MKAYSQFLSGALRMALLTGLGLLCSCATSRVKTEPWRRGNEVIGSITTTKTPWGFECRYKDLRGRAVRIEKRDAQRSYLPGQCIMRISYEEGGNGFEEEMLDATEKLVVNEEWYAVRRSKTSLDVEQKKVIEDAYFDSERKPVCTREGFAIKRSTFAANGKLSKIQFKGVDAAPAPSMWLGVNNVVEVQYAYLQGVSTVVCAAFLDAQGVVLARKELSGTTDFSSYSYNSGPPPPIYGPPVHHAPPPPPPPRIR